MLPLRNITSLDICKKYVLEVFSHETFLYFLGSIFTMKKITHGVKDSQGQTIHYRFFVQKNTKT